MTKFGIVLPTYNRPELLSNALKSIVATNYESLVVCIVDDGSEEKEKYLEILSQYNTDPRIVYIRLDKNLGVNNARNIALNTLIDNHNCEYITLLDDDDVFLQNAFSDANNVIKASQHPWIVLFCEDKQGKLITKCNEEGPLPYIDYFAYTKMKGDAAHFMSTQILRNIKFATEIKNGQEWTFFIQLSKQTNMLVRNFIVVQKNYLEGGLTDTLVELDQEELQELYKKYLFSSGYTLNEVFRRQMKYNILQSYKQKNYLSVFKSLIHIVLSFLKKRETV